MVQPAPPAKQDRSLGELLGDLTQDMVLLVRQEITLARVEMGEKFANVGRQVGLLAVGGALAYSGILAVIASLIIILHDVGMQWWASALVVGIVVAGVGGLLVKKGLDAIKGQDMVPRQTLETLKDIKHG